MITIIYQFKHSVMWHCRIIFFFRFLNRCKYGYTCFWLATIDIYIDGRQPKPRISIFFKNTVISVFGRKYHSTQSVKKL